MQNRVERGSACFERCVEKGLLIYYFVTKTAFPRFSLRDRCLRLLSERRLVGLDRHGTWPAFDASVTEFQTRLSLP